MVELVRNTTVIIILRICLTMMVTRFFSFDQDFYIAIQDISGTQEK